MSDNSSDRVDGVDMESGDRLQESQHGLQELLRRTHGDAPQGHGQAPLQKRI